MPEKFNAPGLQNEKRRNKIASMPDGILIIDKPRDLTSHDVVARLRRLLKTKKIGHTGTLDPFATGVLVMMIGKATRLMRFLHSDEKEYEAVARFGFETDTGDSTGEPRGEPSGKLQFAEHRTQEDDKLKFVGQSAGEDDKLKFVGRVQTILPEFTGEIEQIPPMYSAKKVGGERLYKLAREGKEIEREPVKITISNLEYTGELGAGDGTVDIGFRVACSAGTYVRTLAEDIGRRIGVGCHLAELRRTRAGRFTIDQAKTLEQIEEITENGEIPELLPLTEAVAEMPSVMLSEEGLKRISNGMPVEPESSLPNGAFEVALLSAKGTLAAIGEFDAGEGVIRPRLVVL